MPFSFAAIFATPLRYRHAELRHFTLAIFAAAAPYAAAMMFRRHAGYRFDKLLLPRRRHITIR